LQTTPRRGFYINPSRRGPVPSFRGLKRWDPGEARGAPKGPNLGKIPKIGDFGVSGPGGVPDGPPRGPGVRYLGPGV